MPIKTQKIILDTNILLLPFQVKVDIFSEIDRLCNFPYELCILDKTIGELDAITKKKGRQKDEAKLALTLIKAKSIEMIPSGSRAHTDDILVDLSENGYLIATRDLPLMSRIRKKGAKVITLRQKSHLVML